MLVRLTVDDSRRPQAARGRAHGLAQAAPIARPNHNELAHHHPNSDDDSEESMGSSLMQIHL